MFGSHGGHGHHGALGCAAPAANCVGGGAGNYGPACAAPAANCGPAAAPAYAGPATSCAPAAGPACAAPAANCGPAAGPGCAAPAATCVAASNCSGTPACGSHFGGGFLKGLFGKHHGASGCAATCAAPGATSCTAVDTRCCNADPCEIAKLIYTSQTACYARQRAAALRKLGNRYDCICNPEIMSAFVYGLNDADERVRATAAKEIGDQTRKNCCCSPEVVAALTCALADCDRGVRRKAERALRSCGYDIVDGNCDTCVATGCSNGGCAPVGGSVPSLSPSSEPVSPAPVPPIEKTGSRKGHLSNVLGMRF
ncbi:MULTISPECIES: HEAT repeat domain-containing protein [unclassified Schlesneria]|uniref:HEAT repeat domain-containing protein n=1 Tax=Schlesneria TaxID=656899 RepID=UPI00359F64B7